MFSGYRFEMIVGCMSAGKSSELIRRIERARLAYLPTIIVRPATDTRSRPNLVESRNGLASQAIVVDSPRDILKYSSQAVVIGIDESQFFSDDLIDVVLNLLRQKKKLIASGLDLDYRGKPFGVVPHMLALADRVDKLLAVCRKCGSDFACRTQRLVHSSEQILVGDAQYEARCIHCFEPPYEDQLHLDLPAAKEAPQLSLVSSSVSSNLLSPVSAEFNADPESATRTRV
ncbi:MAG: thymidine kinase [Candidatus Obscuribacterales bacterium]|nr:thymidine kinase [Candidatus Obscuribacterales bacterium]